MAVFATRETTYLDNTASFFNSVKSGRILMMPPITYVKTEILTQNTWYPPPITLNLFDQNVTCVTWEFSIYRLIKI